MKYTIGKAKKGNQIYYFIRNEETGQMDKQCTKYLKHKTLQNRAENTVYKIAKCLRFYMCFLDDRSLSLKLVADMTYADQTAHFSDFLSFIKGGVHTGTYKETSNNTANSYLQAVFGLYEFLHRSEDLNYLKVIDDRYYSYVSAVGVNHNATYKTYDGYLRSNEVRSRMATKEDIALMLQACTNNRDRLLIRLMEETGIRIGEALGIWYTEDIDYANKRIHVRYRSNNPNQAHAKYAEERFMKISDTTFNLLNIYLAENADLMEHTDFLFIVLNGPTKGSPLSAKSFYSVLRHLSHRAGIPVTNHMLRHYFADERRKADWTINDISHALGHKHLATTEQYLHVSSNEIEDAQSKYLKAMSQNTDISAFL